MSIEHIIAKIQKLRKLAEGNTNEHEAAAALAAAQRLMSQHQIEEIMVAQAAGHENGGKAERAGDPLYEGRKIVGWVGRLAAAVARANSCRTLWVSGLGGRKTLIIWGRKSDAQSARYIFRYCYEETMRLSSRYRDTVRERGRVTIGGGLSRAAMTDYRLGCVDAICAALERETAAARKAAMDTHGNSAIRALVVVDARAAEAAEAMKKEFPRMGFFSSSAGGHDYTARDAGRRDGASIYQGKQSNRVGAPAPRLGKGK